MLGLGPDAESGDGTHLDVPDPAEREPEFVDETVDEAFDEEAAGVPCPSCGWVVAPAPTRNRRCPACGEMIVVRRFEGRSVYLTEGAVEVFAAERQRDADEASWDARRGRWLALAASVGAPKANRSRLQAAPPSEAGVEAARSLYVAAADRAASRARIDKRWIDLARIRRSQAAAEYAAVGAPVPPPEDIAALHREGMLALLRSFAAQGADAELVGAACCRACRADDGKVFKINQELRTPRLPHPDCTKGICACDWWIGAVEKKRRRRRSATKPATTATGPEAMAGEPTSEGAERPEGEPDGA